MATGIGRRIWTLAAFAAHLPAAAVMTATAFASTIGAATPREGAAQSLTVVSWGGSYGRTINEAATIPFIESTGIGVNIEDYNGGLAQIRAQVDIGNGRRGMRRVPQENLEFALIADGVPLDQVYATLDTADGVDRAFRKLDTIREQIVWWEAGAQPPQMLADGEVVMSTAYNGRIFNAQVLEDQPFVIVWHGQVFAIGQLAIVAGTPRLEEARRYVAFATSAESLARIGRRISYSPVRRSAMPLVTTHVTAGVEMEPHMPASPANAALGLLSDWNWWADNQDEINERFGAWLAR